jgi:hypothetical protein
MMDSWAKAHLSYAVRSQRHNQIKGEPWSLWIKGHKATSKLSQRELIGS